MIRFILKRIGGHGRRPASRSRSLVFVIFNVIPGGDPALRLAGRRPTQENIIQIRKKWGFDRPYWVQYVDMLDHLFIKRDMISYQDQTQVLPTIERGIPRTLSLARRRGADLDGLRRRDRRDLGRCSRAGSPTAR